MKFIKYTTPKYYVDDRSGKIKRQNYPKGLFKCPECGNLVERGLRDGRIAKTCGCLRRLGKSYTKLYKVFTNIQYTSKGHKIYPNWDINKLPRMTAYLNFEEWAKEQGYDPDKDKTGGYKRIGYRKKDKSKGITPDNLELTLIEGDI